MRELSVFLSVVLLTEVSVPASSGRMVWTYSVSPEGRVDCEPRSIGYHEPIASPSMPQRDLVPTMPTYAVSRPNDPLAGIVIVGQTTEQRLPGDVVALWMAFVGLCVPLRQQFRQAGSLWHLALSLDRAWETTRVALMGAAIEALKPDERELRDLNLCDVAEAILGEQVGNLLRQTLRTQDIRNAHFHAGVFKGSEFVPQMMMPSFRDPSFDLGGMDLKRISQAALIAWLRCGGNFAISPKKRGNNRRTRIRVSPPVVGLIVAIAAVTLTMGWVLGKTI